VRRNALRHALIDNIDADLREPMNVCFARPEITTLQRIVEKAVNTIAVVLIVFRCVNATLSGD
jgi:hypothetical protein